MALIASYNPSDPRSMYAWPGYAPGQGEQLLNTPGFVGNRFWYGDEDTRLRIQRYVDMEALMDVEAHYGLYAKTAGGNAPGEHDWIPVDFPGMLARLMRHYALGPEFGVSAKKDGADVQVQRILEDGQIVERLRQCAEAFPVFGDAVLRIDIEEIEDESTVSGSTTSGQMIPQAKPKFIHPACFHPEFDPLDATRVVAVTLAYVFPFEEGQRRDPHMPFVVLKETHVPGLVTYSAVEWNGCKEGEPVNVQSAFPGVEDGSTGIDEIPVVHIAYNAQGGCAFGRSEFARVIRLFLALENRLTQENEILERHARPKLIVGPGVLGPDGLANLSDFDVIEIDPSILEKAVKPEYLTWDPKIDAMKHQIETLLEFFFITTETSPASFGMERSGSQVESARALRFKAHRTINKIEDLRDALAHAIKKLFRVAQKLENAARVEDGIEQYERTLIDINWPDPIVEDHTQDATDYVALKGAGLVSSKRAVQDLFNLTPEEAAVEVEAIQEDQETSNWLPDRVMEAAAQVAESETDSAGNSVPGGKPAPFGKKAPGAQPAKPADAPAPKK